MASLETVSLPKLPVPELSQTMTGYLEAVQVAVVDEEQKGKTRSLVERFLDGGTGPKLQELLIEKQDKEENWAYHWWMDDMYMTIDLPLPVNSNPGMVFPARPTSSGEDNSDDTRSFVRDVATFINAILDNKELIDRNLVPQDRAPSREKGQPLCMAQYQRLFTSYRAPGLDKDQLKSLSSEENEHIIVAHQGQFWRLEVRHKGRRLPTEEMALNLEAIIESEGQKRTTTADDADPNATTQHPPRLGLLTTANRRLWAQWRHQLLQDLINARSLQSIETSCMIICIDRAAPSLNDEELDGDSHRALQMIHGGGSDWNSANRWFDKTIQFIFSPDGGRGICYEHSAAEGIVLVQVIENALEKMKADASALSSESTDNQNVSGNAAATGNDRTDLDGFPTPKKLTWKIDDGINQAITTAQIDMDRLVENLDFKVFRFTSYGKNRIKTFNVSPDVYIQLMLQLTYFKLHGKLVATYESASTRRYRLGRVDNIRSASIKALDWVKAMIDPQSLMEEKIRLFYGAAENQTDVMVRNILGQGIDIHLLGLRQLSRENGCTDGIALFDEDPSYKDVNHFALSTSQVPTSTPDSFMGYGPVVPDGYGCSYNPHSESIIFCVSTFRSCGMTSTRAFVSQLTDVLDEVAQLLTK